MIMIEVEVRGVQMDDPDLEDLTMSLGARGARGVAMTYDSHERSLHVRCHDDSMAMVLVVDTTMRRFFRDRPGTAPGAVYAYQVTRPA